MPTEAPPGRKAGTDEGTAVVPDRGRGNSGWLPLGGDRKGRSGRRGSLEAWHTHWRHATSCSFITFVPPRCLVWVPDTITILCPLVTNPSVFKRRSASHTRSSV